MWQSYRTAVYQLIILAYFFSGSLAFSNAAQPQDSSTPPAAAVKTAKGTGNSKIGKWAVNIGKTDSGALQVEIRLAATEPYTASDGSDLNTADFVIGCTHGQTVAFVDWKAHLVNDDNEASTMNVAYSLDNAPSLNSDWDISSDKRSLISKQSVEFIQSLNGKRRLELLLVPDGLGQETVIFNLANLEAVLKLVGEQCYN